MATIGEYNVVTDGLVLSLDAANGKSYVSGSTAWNNMVSSSSFTIVYSGVSKTTCSFESSPAGILISQSLGPGLTASPISGYLEFSENLCIEFWYKTDTTALGSSDQYSSPGIIQIGNYASNSSLTLWDWSVNTPNSRRINTLVNNGSTWSHTQSSNSSYSDFNWCNKYHQIVMNFSGSIGKWNKYTLYIDTIEQSNINFSIPFPSSSIAGGNTLYLPGANGGAAKNTYAFLKVYNRTLSTQEILQNYNALKSRFNL